MIEVSSSEIKTEAEMWKAFISEVDDMPVEDQINLPAKNITNCTFAGQNYNEIFVTSACSKMNAKEISKYPLSGGLFKILTNHFIL